MRWSNTSNSLFLNMLNYSVYKYIKPKVALAKFYFISLVFNIIVKNKKFLKRATSFLVVFLKLIKLKYKYVDYLEAKN